jgi:hypothetical protein
MKNMIKTISGIVAIFMLAVFPITSQAAAAPTINTLAAGTTTATTVTLNGFFNANGAPTSTWFKYGTSATNLNANNNPTNRGSGSGQFSETITGLTPNTTYYYKAAGSNFYGTTFGSSTLSFTTGVAQNASLTLTTLTASNITTTTAKLNSHYTATVASPTVWFKYGTSASNLNQLTGPQAVVLGSNTISANISGLQPGTTYYFKATGIQNGTTVNANTTLSFTTVAAPQASMSVTTIAQNSVTTNSANLNGYITMTNTTATSRYFKWGTSASNLNNTLTVSGSQTAPGMFTGALAGLTPSTTYYFKAYAVNGAGVTVPATTTLQFTTVAAPAIYACNDGSDNDNDGLTDFPSDPGCSSSTDTNEYNVPPVTYSCSDGADNDSDGLTDFPSDPGCTSPTDTNEYNVPPVTYACNDGYDNDNDGLTDFPQDPGCSSANDQSEYNVPPATYACNDGADNDNDGLTDFPSDPGCSSATDQNEYNVPPTTYACSDGNDNDNDGLTDFPQDPGCNSANDPSEYNVPPVTYACNDGADNDGDGLVDLQDPGCLSSNDNNENNVINNGIAPTVTTGSAGNISYSAATLGGTINANNSFTYYWFAYGTNGSLNMTTPQMSFGVSNGQVDQSIGNLQANTVYSFKLCASNAYGSNCGSVQSFLTLSNNGGGGCTYNCGGCTSNCGGAPIVNTSSASNVTDTSAVLYGYVNANGAPAQVSFKYGQNGNLYMTAFPNQPTTTAQDNFSAFAPNLQPNTVYAFQICASNQYGQNCGNVLSFLTTNTNAYVPVQPPYPPYPNNPQQPNQPPIIIYTNTGGNDYVESYGSLATLKLTASKRDVVRDDLVSYNVTLTNNSNRSLKNVEMHVNAPMDLVLASTSMGEISFASNSVTVKFATLAAGESKTFTVTARVASKTTATSFVVHSDASYLNTKTGERETVTAELMTGMARNGLLAGVFGAGFGGSIIWFLVIILIALLLVLLFSRDRRREPAAAPMPPSRWPTN